MQSERNPRRRLLFHLADELTGDALTLELDHGGRLVLSVCADGIECGLLLVDPTQVHALASALREAC